MMKQLSVNDLIIEVSQDIEILSVDYNQRYNLFTIWFNKVGTITVKTDKPYCAIHNIDGLALGLIGREHKKRSMVLGCDCFSFSYGVIK